MSKKCSGGSSVLQASAADTARTTISPTGMSNVNTVRRGRANYLEEREDNRTNIEGNLITELRLFRSEVVARLDSQAEAIRSIQELCTSTKTELLLLQNKMKVCDEVAVKIVSIETQLASLILRNKELETTLNLTQQSQKPVDIVNNRQKTFAEIIMDHPRSNINLPVDIDNSKVNKCRATKPAGEQRYKKVSISEPQVTINVSDLERSSRVRNEWTEVQRKKGRNIIKDIKKGQNTSIMDIQGMEKKKYIHIWRLHPETTEAQLLAHLKNRCDADVDIKIDKIKHKTERNYASFVIGVPETRYDELSRPEVWPVNAEFSEWIWFRRATKKQSSEK